MENAVKLLILVLVVGTSMAEEDVRREDDGKSFLEKIPGGDQKRERFQLPNPDFHRRTYENRSRFNKRVTAKWDRKPEPREVEEDDYFTKANRNALVSKTVDGKDENFDSYNMKILNGGKRGERRENREKTGPSTVEREKKWSAAVGNPFGNDDGQAAERRFPSSGDDADDNYLATARHRKMRKHGNDGFVPFPLPQRRKPNIILILTDDQDVELGSLNFMPKTLRLLRDGGAEFRHAYVTTPMCCPSRSSLLTGMYVHNHEVYTNNENCSSVRWQQTHETRTFATYLSNAGYRTGYFGKYLNKYNGSYVPPGWREWGGLIMNSRYYNYSINMNGKKIKHGFDYRKDYYPDLIANDSITFLRQSKQYFSRKPVMLVVSFPAPHGPEDSAPEYSKMFFNVTTHHTPAYDYAPNPDKQWILQVTNKMQDIHKRFTDMLMTKRLQTLQSVDSAVERIYQELKNIGELDNTYIIYTSDHGYHLGQFGLVKGKSFPFEFDVRVPFLVRGPGIEPGTVVDDIVLNIDLAPTFLDIAGVESPLHMDGRSIARLLLHRRSSKRRRMKWPDTFLIESSGRREIPDANSEGKKLKHNKSKSKTGNVTETERHEAVKHPPGGTVNAGPETSIDSSEIDTVDDVEEEISEVEDNTSPSFPQGLGFGETPVTKNSESQVDNKIPQIVQSVTRPVPKLARLAVECQSPELRTPCQPGQKWHCVADGNRWRKYKCKFQKKCTCFTPDGFQYTRFYSEDRGPGNHDQHHGFRRKRSDEFDDIWKGIPESVEFATVLSLMKRSSDKWIQRKKRDNSDDRFSAVLDDLQQELYEAEETKSSINATISLGEEPNVSRCSVTYSGKVNCSGLVYRDFKTWKKSRDQIEAKIKSLKAELEALKGIRKHLREKRPETGPTSTESFSTSPRMREDFKNDTSEDYFTTESYEMTNETVFSSAITRRYFSKMPVTREPEILHTSTENSYPTYSTTEIEKTTEIVPKGRNRAKSKNGEDGSVNKIHGIVTVNRGRDRCICRRDNEEAVLKEMAKEAKRRQKEERLRKKERKLKKKAKLEKECLSERMNCFIHDNEHWKTPPLWTEGPFCFCMNANNNTYSCLRTINSTHNFLYCEFITGFKTFYNLRIDPFEQLNRIYMLTPDESRFLSNQLADMKACKGAKECTTGSIRENISYGNFQQQQQHQHNHHHHHHHHHHHLQQPHNTRL